MAEEDLRALRGRQLLDATPAGWALLLSGLQTRVRVPDFAAGAALVTGIGEAARRVGHAPVVTLRADAVDVRLTTPAAHDVTAQDVRLAAEITAVVHQAGLEVSTRGTTALELGLDTPDRAEIAGFWAAVLQVEPGSNLEPDDEVSDPTHTLPTVWFQASGAEEPRQRWHPDVWIDPGEVADRVAAAVGAGGRLVSDAEAPAFWVLADPQGNQVCLCTWQGRD